MRPRVRCVRNSRTLRALSVVRVCVARGEQGECARLEAELVAARARFSNAEGAAQGHQVREREIERE